MSDEYKGILADVEFTQNETDQLTPLPDGWTPATLTAYQLAQHEDAREIELRQLRAQLDAANQRALQESQDLRQRLNEAREEAQTCHKVIAELQENITKEREAKLHQTELQLQAVKERDELKRKYGATN